jgi:hypothetical protein
MRRSGRILPTSTYRKSYHLAFFSTYNFPNSYAFATTNRNANQGPNLLCPNFQPNNLPIITAYDVANHGTNRL